MLKARNYAHEYATYQGTPEQIKDRAKRNAARAKIKKSAGAAAIAGKDVHHKSGLSNARTNLAIRSKSANRADHR